MGKIVVTGAAGMIGSAVIARLNQQGWDEIIAVDMLGETESYRNLIPLHIDDYVEADRFGTAIAQEPRYFGDIRAVCHFAGVSDPQERDHRKLISVNYELSKQMCEWALACGARFVYASSAATYGDGSQGMDDLAETISRYRPLNMYGYSKQLFDIYAQRRGYLSRIAGLKFFNVFGPNESHKGKTASLVYQTYCAIKSGQRVTLYKSHRPDYGDGEQKRDFLYVKDAGKVVEYMALQSAAGGLFNVGSGEAHTWNELIQTVFDALELPLAIEYVAIPEALRDKYQYYTRADIGKLRKSGYREPMTSLREAVFDYVHNYLELDQRLME